MAKNGIKIQTPSQLSIHPNLDSRYSINHRHSPTFICRGNSIELHLLLSSIPIPIPIPLMNLIPGIAARQRLLPRRLPLIIILSRVDILPPDKTKQSVECRCQK